MSKSKRLKKQLANVNGGYKGYGGYTLGIKRDKPHNKKKGE